jgi:cell wall assembly regulator SMI1
MVSPRSDPDRPPAPVAESWRRIEAWLDEHLPAVKTTLRPGVTDEDPATFEDALGRPLPDEVRQSWKVHDGQKEGRGNTPGLLYGKSLLALASRDTVAGRSALEEWQNLARRADKGAALGDPGETSYPPGAIRCFSQVPGLIIGRLHHRRMTASSLHRCDTAWIGHPGHARQMKM